MWHDRLGHPSNQVLHHMLSTLPSAPLKATHSTATSFSLTPSLTRKLRMGCCGKWKESGWFKEQSVLTLGLTLQQKVQMKMNPSGFRSNLLLTKSSLWGS
uniref:Putative translationally controlled tumor protein n=1 Tax=Davidia involucrata TaxID=16924 RepID=A0A5B7B452_DAVIN